VRLADGTVWINSPVVASREEMESIAHLGPVKHLVAPTPLHEWRLQEWTRVFPQAQVWVAPPVRDHANLSRGVLSDEPPAAWAQDIDQTIFRGSSVLNEVYFLHRKSRTLIFCDFIQNYSPQPGKLLRNAVMKWAGVLGGGVPIDIRLSCARNKAQARSSLSRLLSWDFDNVVLAHGKCIEGDAKTFVRSAFRWLDG
jgi:uncharacterized protein DUF4336